MQTEKERRKYSISNLLTLCDICCCSLCAVSHSCSVFLKLLFFICFLNAPLKSGTYAVTSPARDGSSHQKSGTSGHPVINPFKLHPSPLAEFKTKVDLCSPVLGHRPLAFLILYPNTLSRSAMTSATLWKQYICFWLSELNHHSPAELPLWSLTEQFLGKCN